MCKPMLVTVPFVLLLLDYWPLNRFGTPANRFSISRKLIVEKIPLIVFSIVVVHGDTSGSATRQGNFLFPANQQCACILCRLLRTNVLSGGIGCLVSLSNPWLAGWKNHLALLLLVAVSAGAFCWRQKHPHFLMGWLWYLGMLVPVIGLVQVGAQARADRYTYLPQIGLYILLTWTVVELTASWRSRRWVLGGGAMVVLAVLITCARAQTAYWRDSESLWTHTLACTPDNSIAHNNLGNVFLEQGRMDEAIAQFQKALAINPDDDEAHNNLGNAFLQQGRWTKPSRNSKRRWQSTPTMPKPQQPWRCLSPTRKVGRSHRAIPKGAGNQPRRRRTYYNLGNAFLQQGRIDEAIAQYQKALAINPDDADIHNNLGNIFLQRGRMEKPSRISKRHWQSIPTMPKPTTILAMPFSSRDGWMKPSRNTKRHWQSNPTTWKPRITWPGCWPPARRLRCEMGLRRWGWPNGRISLPAGKIR